MSSPKSIKNPRLRRTMIELKNLEDTTEGISRIERLEIEIISESTKIKLSVIEKEKTNKKNELGENFRIKTAMRRRKEKPASFKTKNKETARKKIELEKEIKTEIIIKAEKSKVEILREIIGLQWKKIKKKEMERLIIEEINQRVQ